MAEDEEKAAIPVDIKKTEDVEISDPKQGSKCCGFCCDYRRAVIVLAIIGMTIEAVFMILAVVGTFTLASTIDADNENAEEFVEIVEEEFNAVVMAVIKVLGAFGTTVLAILCALGLAFFFFMLVAAVWYSVCMLATVLLMNLLNLIFWLYLSYGFYQTQEENAAGKIAGAWIGWILFFGLVNYPIVGLIVEIRKGIMSRETYPREAYSCCCQP